MAYFDGWLRCEKKQIQPSNCDITVFWQLGD